MAHDLLGPERVLCVTAVSPSLAPEEEADCRALAAEWGLRWVAVPTAEMDDPAYVANGADRCAHCKTALMDVVEPLARSEGATVVLGVNLDDLGDHRPGQPAAAARGARFPLVDAGFTKASVREWSRRIGLRTWDKPAAACLASRVPYGTPVTVGTLRSVARAESALRRLGLRRAPGPPPRRRGPDRGPRGRPRHGRRATRRRRRRRAGRPGTPSSRSTSRGSAPAASTGCSPSTGVPGEHGTRGCSVSTVKVQVKLTFPESLVRMPVLARMVRHFDVDPNIRRANVEEHRWLDRLRARG